MKKLFATFALCSAVTLTTGTGHALQHTVSTVTSANGIQDFQPVVNNRVASQIYGDVAWELEGQIVIQTAGGSNTVISNPAYTNQFAHINTAGQVVWEATDNVNSTRYIMLYTPGSGSLMLSSPTALAHSPYLNENGEVVWIEAVNNDDEVMYYHLSTGTLQITSTGHNMNRTPTINNVGTIVWAGTDTEPDYEIFYQKAGTSTISKANPTNTYDDNAPDINDLDDIVWVANTTVGNGNIFLKPANASYVEISADASDEQYPLINNAGHITWIGKHATPNQDIFQYTPHNGITLLSTNSFFIDSNPDMNEEGDVVWESDNGTNFIIKFYDRSAGTVVTLSTADDNFLPRINNYGTVVWESDNGVDSDIHRSQVNRTVDSDGDGQTINQGDCDEARNDVYTGAAELCSDLLDNNCNGTINEGCQVCGNGLKEGNEQCDDGNLIDGDSCSSTCDLPPSVSYPATVITTSLREKLSLVMNVRGDMAWTEDLGNPNVNDSGTEVFYYDAATALTHRLTDNLTYDRKPIIADNGDVVWYGHDGLDAEIFVWQYGTFDGNGIPVTKRITGGTDNRTDDSGGQINENHEITWVALKDGKQQIQYTKYNVTTPVIVNVTSGSSYNNAGPRINNSGQIVWQRSRAGEDSEIFIYDLTDPLPIAKPLINNIYEDMSPEINDSGDVVWSSKLGADENSYEILLYDRQQSINQGYPQVYQITSDNSRDADPKINKSGDIVFEKIAGSDRDIFAYIRTSGVTLQLTDNTEEDFRSVLADSGDVMWIRDYMDPENPGVLLYSEIFAYNIKNGASTQVTNDGKDSFTPSVGAILTDPQNNIWEVRAAWGTYDPTSNFEQIFAGMQSSMTDMDGDGYFPPTDCNDNPADPMARFINPGATEVCDAIDNNCDGQIDEGISTVYWRDSDNDGFGDPADAVSDCGGAPVGYVDSALGADCNDSNNAIKPGIAEVCEAYGTPHVDNNCDGLIEDPAAGYKEWYYDADGDGYGDPDNATYPAMIECDPLTIPAGYVDGTLGADCNDNPADQSAAGINPGAADSSIDGVDQNCDGVDGPISQTSFVYFPAIKDGPHADGLWKNFISIQAKDPSVPVNVIIKLYNSDGSLKFQANDVTPVNGRLVKTPNWIMFANLSVEAFDGTVVVEAEAPILGMTNTIAPNEEGFNIYEAPTPRTSLFFPAAYDNFASGSGYQNILHLQNINPTPTTVTVEYIHDFSGTVTDVATIPAYGEYEKNVRVVFGGGFNGTIRVTTDGASVGGMLRYEYLVANKIEAMTLYEATVERSEIYLPYLYDGFGGNKNFIATMNISAAPVTCNYDFYQNAGDTGSGPLFSTSQIINPGARFSTTPSYVACGAVGCTNFTGSMVATCDGNVVSTTNFITTSVEGFSIYEAADPKALMVFPQIYDNLNGYANEVHIQNPTGSTINVGLELYFSDGTLLGTTSQAIGPFGTYVMRPYTINTAPGGYQTNGSLTVRLTGGALANGVMSYTKPTFFDVYEAVAP